MFKSMQTLTDIFVEPVQVVDESSGNGEGVAVNSDEAEIDIKSASELFEAMARKHNFNPDDVNTLSARDLVILYENIDLGTRLMSTANELNRKKPNRIVETIVSNDNDDTDSEESDICDIEDVINFVFINKEDTDLHKNSSDVNALCQKFGDLSLKLLESDYKNNSVTEKFKLNNELFGLPPSLFDYLRRRSPNDSSADLYMENMIKYVQHTIEQLKRISNGDYLTDKTKAKWREAMNLNNNGDKDKSMITMTSSLPMTLDIPSSFNVSWHDIAHSEEDIKYLSELLEKRVVLDVPKIFTQMMCNSNFLKNLKEESTEGEQADKDTEEESVEVVIMAKSQDNFVFNNYFAVSRNAAENKSHLLSLEFDNEGKEEENVNKLSENVTEHKEPKENEAETDKDNCINSELFQNSVIREEISEVKENNSSKQKDPKTGEGSVKSITSLGSNGEISDPEYPKESSDGNEHEIINSDYPDAERSDHYQNSYEFSSNFEKGTDIILISESSSDQFDEKLIRKRIDAETNFFTEDMPQPQDLCAAVQSLKIQPLPEENTENVVSDIKSKSPARKRTKSPYENPAFKAEERRRLKLLEIREKRERKKKILLESTKLKQLKSFVPQASNSVTQLSISNKSFYNSIYGPSERGFVNDKVTKVQIQRLEYSNSDLSKSDSDEERDGSILNKSDEFDNIFVHVRDKFIPDTVSEAYDTSETLKVVNILSPCTVVGAKEKDNSGGDNAQRTTKVLLAKKIERAKSPKIITKPKNSLPSSPKGKTERSPPKKINPKSTEFRKNIDKIYEVMRNSKKIEQKRGPNMKTNQTCSSIQYSDSGTSIKHNRITSIGNNLSFDKLLFDTKMEQINQNTVDGALRKVIINSQTYKNRISDDNKSKKRPHVPFKVENPLRTISQLIQDIEHVQKARLKSGDVKSTKSEFQAKKNERLNRSMNSRATATSIQNLKGNVASGDKNNVVKKPSQLQSKSPKLEPKLSPKLSPKMAHTTPHHDDKNIIKIPKKQVADIVDELKEARGEAVRGPSFWNTRLNSLAQPRKAYVQATIQECEAKYGRNLISHKLQRMVESKYPSKNNAALKKSRVGYDRPSRAQQVDDSLKKQLSISEKDTKTIASHTHSKRENVLSKIEKEYLKDKVVTEKSRKMVAVETFVQNHYQEQTTRKPLSLDLNSKLVVLSEKIVEESSSVCSSSEENLNETDRSTKSETEAKVSIGQSKPSTGIREFAAWKKDQLAATVNVTTASGPSESYVLNSDQDSASDNIDSSDNTDNSKQQDPKTEIEKYRASNTEKTSESKQRQVKNSSIHHLTVGTFPEKFRNISQSTQPLILLNIGAMLRRNLVKSASQQFLGSKSLELLNNFDWNLPTIICHPNAVPFLQRTYSNTINTIQNSSELIWPLRAVAGQIFIKNCSLQHFSHTAFKDTSSSCKSPVDNEPLTFDTESKASNKEIRKTKIIKNVALVENTETPKPIIEIKHVQQATCYPKDDSMWSKQKESKNERSFSIPTAINNSNNNNKDVDFSSSLDILTELLNEIKKITISQTQIVENEIEKTTDVMETKIKNEKKTSVLQNKNLSDMMETQIENVNPVKLQNNNHEIISIASQRRIESSHSNITGWVSTDTTNISKEQITVDEKIVVEINSQLVNKEHTDTKRISVSEPSCNKNDLFVEKIETPFTNKCNNNVCEADELPLNDLNAVDNDLNVDVKQIDTDKRTVSGIYINKQSDKEVSVKIVSVKNLVDEFTEKPSLEPVTVDVKTNISDSTEGLLSQPSNETEISFTGSSEAKTIVILDENKELDPKSNHLVDIEKKNDVIATNEIISTEKTITENKKVPKMAAKKDIFDDEMDPQLELKRDILVTVYSILVFTVFAALSFPDIVYDHNNIFDT